MPLEFFLPPVILNDMNSMHTVEKISKEFELERLKRILDLDKKKSIGNKRLLVQEKIDHLNTFGKDYTRLEIAAARNKKGPKKDKQIRAYIDFLNKNNIIKDEKVTSLDVIQNPYYLEEGLEQFQKVKQNREKSLQRKDNGLERKRKLEVMCQEKSDEERKRRRFEVERRSEKLQGKFAVQKRQQESYGIGHTKFFSP
jgi:hypothetical protein